MNGAIFGSHVEVPSQYVLPPAGRHLFTVKPHKPVLHEFVLDAIATLSPKTRSMFGCLAIYVQDEIVLILRDKRDQAADNGVWLAITEDQHRSLRREFPNMRSIQVLGKKVTGRQVLPADAKDFEEAALHAYDLVLAVDPRIGKVPRETASIQIGDQEGTKSSKQAKAPKRPAKARKMTLLSGLAIQRVIAHCLVSSTFPARIGCNWSD